VAISSQKGQLWKVVKTFFGEIFNSQKSLRI
jgi:hypothetical protein